jgi:hypothetical protein
MDVTAYELYQQKKIEETKHAYEKITRRLRLKLPPIIYHYSAKNILCF